MDGVFKQPAVYQQLGVKMKTIKSKRFGHWELRADGLSQHDMTSKQMRKFLMDSGMTKKQATSEAREMKRNECWYDATGKYKVVLHELIKGTSRHEQLVHDGTEGITWLSIRRIDDPSIYACDWRDMQAIKNDLCSPIREAVEIYPSEERVHDTSNVFHLWVLPEGALVPVGYMHGVDVNDQDDPTQRKLNT
tara:strand:- start:44 stop:619 length:576 start_codon:yes stop_codon:yes gene_type:complete